MRGTPRAELNRRVGEALALVKLEQHANKLPGQLSGGQQQRVAIARAVVLEPRLVLMDEPLSNLDAKLRLEMRTEIRRLHQSLGLTTVYVTHDQEEALSLADRLVVLREGRVQQIGTPQELHDNPANWHVADFMGYRNLLDLTVDSVDGDRARVSGAGLSLTGHVAHRASVGDAVRVAIRPHDLVVAGAGASAVSAAASAASTTQSVNTIQATVSVVEYQGREFAVEVTTDGGQNLFVHAAEAPRPGDRVALAADPNRVLVYQADLDAEPTAAEPQLAQVS
jgi:putative spermidine/putrescine transport system ATP-binding protein